MQDSGTTYETGQYEEGQRELDAWTFAIPTPQMCTASSVNSVLHKEMGDTGTVPRDPAAPSCRHKFARTPTTPEEGTSRQASIG